MPRASLGSEVRRRELSMMARLCGPRNDVKLRCVKFEYIILVPPSPMKLIVAPHLAGRGLIAARSLAPRAATIQAHAAAGFSLPELEPFFEVALQGINYGAGILLTVACLGALLNAIIFLVNATFGTEFRRRIDFLQLPPGKPSLTLIRFSLCSMILTSLNFLVAVDVIETLIKPASLYKLVDLYKLSIVAGVRTLLAYFLGKETEELEHELEKSSGVSLTA